MYHKTKQYLLLTHAHQGQQVGGAYWARLIPASLTHAHQGQQVGGAYWVRLIPASLEILQTLPLKVWTRLHAPIQTFLRRNNVWLVVLVSFKSLHIQTCSVHDRTKDVFIDQTHLQGFFTTLCTFAAMSETIFGLFAHTLFNQCWSRWSTFSAKFGWFGLFIGYSIWTFWTKFGWFSQLLFLIGYSIWTFWTKFGWIWC